MIRFKIFLIIFSILYLKFDYLASAQSFFTVKRAINPNSVGVDTGQHRKSVPKMDTGTIKKGRFFSKVNSPTFNLHLPLKQLHLTSPFGRRLHPVLGKRLKHNGIDLRANFQPVFSISFGIVERVGRDRRSGNYVVINNFNDIETVFCHLAKVLVKSGDTLKSGEPFAISGSTGMVTGPHLHFGLKVKGEYINPLPLLLAIRKKVNSLALNNTY